MSKEPKFIQLERQILKLKLEQLNILIKQRKATITSMKGYLEEIEISEKNFPGIKERYKNVVLQTASSIEREELSLESQISERKTIQLSLQWWEKPKKKKGKKK